MKALFNFTRRKGPPTTRIRGDVNRHSIGSHSSISNRSLVIQLIRGAYNIDLAKVDQSFSKLHKACFLNSDLNKIKKYLKQGANPNQLDNVSRSSPLHLATVNGNINVIRLLIEYGGNIDLPDGDGKTLVIKAIECFHKECLQFLILQGSDLNVGDNQLGNTALHWSIVNSFADGLKLLLAYSQRINVNCKNKAGESPLHLLVRCPDLHGYVGDLLEKGAEIDIRNNNQRTPLMVACELGYMEMARILVNRGSYIYHQDEAGFSALGVAKRNGHANLAQYLTDLGGFESPRRGPEIETDIKTVADSWPSTEEEDELDEENTAKNRKFDPIIQQLKSLQGVKQDDRLLQPSETSQTKRETQVKPSISDDEQLFNQLKSSVGRESNYLSNLMVQAGNLDTFTKARKDVPYYGEDNKSRNEKEMMRRPDEGQKKEPKNPLNDDNLVMKSLPLKNLDNREAVSTDPTLGHIDSVYSHGTSNDEFIREIKNLLDEEIRENDELDALLFASSVSTVGNGGDNIKLDDTNQKRNDSVDQSTHHYQSTSKIVHKSESIESSALRKSSSDPANSAILAAASSNPEESTTSTTETANLKPGPSQSKTVIHVDILSDLWEDWGKSDETEEELSSDKTLNGLTKDFSYSKGAQDDQKISNNGEEILGTFFLNDVSDESSEEIELEEEEKDKKEKEEEKVKEKDEGMKKKESKKDNQKEVKKGQSSEAEKRKSLVKDEDSSLNHRQQTISSSLTPITKHTGTDKSAILSMDKPEFNVSTNLIASQSTFTSLPLPSSPPPPPSTLSPPPPLLSPPLPPALLTPSTSTLSSTTATAAAITTFSPPVLPPRPVPIITNNSLKTREEPIERTHIEVQTELDELIPQLKELERLKEESENKVKHLQLEMNKQSKEAERNRRELMEEINCMEKENQMLEKRLEEMKGSRERLIEEKKRLTENEAKLMKRLESYEECKCSQLKEELRQVKEKVKSRVNNTTTTTNNDEFIRKLHDLNDECNDLRRELSKEQTALKEEISQLERDKEVFKLENQWLKEKLEEMRKHLSSQEERRSEEELRRRKVDEEETLEEMRKVMVTVESLVTKLDDKISGLNLEEQKKLMEKIIVELAKSQINRQVETMFKGIRSLLEDLHSELNSFQLTIEKQMNGENKVQSDETRIKDLGDSSSSSSSSSSASTDQQQQQKQQQQSQQVKEGTKDGDSSTRKMSTNGFSVFESRISQLTSSIEKLEDNIERQELQMLIRARGHIWSTLSEREEDDGQICQDKSSSLINLFNDVNKRMNSNGNNKSTYPDKKPRSGFVQSLMRLQSNDKPGYNQLINCHVNYEPSVFDFNHTKNNLAQQIANLKTELGLTR